MSLSSNEFHSGAASLHLRDDSPSHENQTLGHVATIEEVKRMRGRRVELTAWVKQVAASSHKVVGIGLWGRTATGRTLSASDWTGTTRPTGWCELHATLAVPEDASLLIAQIHCAGGYGETGEAFFDDISLRAIAASEESCATNQVTANTPPEDAFIASFENQGAILSDKWSRPSISRGCFWQDGRPVFFTGPWIYPRTHIDWKDGNPDPQGIGHRAYTTAPGKAIFESMGFNASQLSSAWALPGMALYGLKLPDGWQKSAELIDAFFLRFGGQPMVVDFAFGFADKLKEEAPDMAREIGQQNGGWHQFVPFCPESTDGRRYYEAYLRGGALSALRGGANVFLWELFNESVYKCMCRGNARLFADYAKALHGTVERANSVWHTAFADFADVARQTDFRQFRRLWPDYMKFMACRYAEVLAMCREAIRDVDRRTNVHFTEQSSTFTLTDARGSGMDYRLVADTLDVLAYEGGVRFGDGGTRDNVSEAEAAAFSSSIEHLFNIDFYRALSRGAKPIVNNEHYCLRIKGGRRVPSRAEDIVTSLWMELFHGSSGAFTYCWDKRSWEWKNTDEARKVVEQPSYKSASLLNPWNYPPEALEGFTQFRRELAPLSDTILPRRHGVPPSVAVFFSYPTLRMLDLDDIDYRSRLLRWYGAILGAHYPLQIVFEEELEAGLPERVRALVIPSASYATEASAAALGRFLARGGSVIADVGAFLRDERGDPLSDIPDGVVRLDSGMQDSVSPLLDAIAKSGAEKLAEFEANGCDSGTASWLPCDIQTIDCGEMQLLLLVDMGAVSRREGILKWHVPRDGRYRLSNAVTGQVVLNGGLETWSAADLSRGIPVTVNPQERLLLRLDAER